MVVPATVTSVQATSSSYTPVRQCCTAVPSPLASFLPTLLTVALSGRGLQISVPDPTRLAAVQRALTVRSPARTATVARASPGSGHRRSHSQGGDSAEQWPARQENRPVKVMQLRWTKLVMSATFR